MTYTVHLKYPIMYMEQGKLKLINKLECPVEPHIITQDGERYVELPKTKYRIDESPFRGLNYFVPITYYSNDDIPTIED